jgi:steroid delta-isomerase-like uncharacterized protein
MTTTDAPTALSAAVDAWNRGDLDAYLEMYDESILLHGYTPEPMTKAQVRGFYEAMFVALPDGRLEFHEVLWPDPDTAVVRFTLAGTQRGEFLGVPPTGLPMALPGITIIRFRDGRAIERWSQADMLGGLIQIGAIPAPT